VVSASSLIKPAKNALEQSTGVSNSDSSNHRARFSFAGDQAEFTPLDSKRQLGKSAEGLGSLPGQPAFTALLDSKIIRILERACSSFAGSKADHR
jgi:hypothetical protein